MLYSYQRRLFVFLEEYIYSTADTASPLIIAQILNERVAPPIRLPVQNADRPSLL